MRLSLAVILALVGLSLAACKSLPTRSGVKTLSAQELQDCGTFNGDRLMMTIGPAEDAQFGKDLGLAQRDFVQSMSTTSLTGYSYFQNGGRISAPCRLYVQTEQAKYRNFLSLSTSVATEQGIADGLAALGKEIARLRLLHANDAQGSKYQIQIMIALGSHGGDLPLNPDGIVLLGDKTTMTFANLVTMIQTNLLTVCPDDNCSTLDATQQRKADEVMILLETCYSGRFNTALRAALAQAPGYTEGTLDQGSDSKATRVISFVSSGPDQTSPGQAYAGTRNGIMFESFDEMLRFWEGDKNNDNALSIAEVRDVLTTHTLQPSMQFTRDYIDQSVLKPLVCADPAYSTAGAGVTGGVSTSGPSTRTGMLNALNADPSQLQAFFAAPIQSLEQGSIAEMSITVPGFFSNLKESYLQTLLLAVGGRGSATPRTGLSQADLESQITARVALIQKLYTHLSVHPRAEFSASMPDLSFTAEEQALLKSAAPTCFTASTTSQSSTSLPQPSAGEPASGGSGGG